MNFFGMLGQIGRILPGYVQGRQQAIQDNWQDLQNYNTGFHGQLQNAFDQSTFEPQLRDIDSRSRMLQMAAQQAATNHELFTLLAPYQRKYAIPNFINNQLMSQVMMSLQPQISQQWLNRLQAQNVQQPAGQQPPAQQPTAVEDLHKQRP